MIPSELLGASHYLRFANFVWRLRFNARIDEEMLLLLLQNSSSHEALVLSSISPRFSTAHEVFDRMPASYNVIVSALDV